MFSFVTFRPYHCHLDLCYLRSGCDHFVCPWFTRMGSRFWVIGYQFARKRHTNWQRTLCLQNYLILTCGPFRWAFWLNIDHYNEMGTWRVSEQMLIFVLDGSDVMESGPTWLSCCVEWFGVLVALLTVFLFHAVYIYSCATCDLLYGILYDDATAQRLLCVHVVFSDEFLVCRCVLCAYPADGITSLISMQDVWLVYLVHLVDL